MATVALAINLDWSLSKLQRAITVAILAQGTNWADAVTQAFCLLAASEGEKSRPPGIESTIHYLLNVAVVLPSRAAAAAVAQAITLALTT
jgi:hypothetical protein